MILKTALLMTFLLFPMKPLAETKSNDVNKSKLLTLGETGRICEKGTAYFKLGLNWWLPTLNLAYAPFKKWEFDLFMMGIPTFHAEDVDTIDAGFNIFRLGFKRPWLSKKKFLYSDDYTLSWGLKLHRFKFLFVKNDTTHVDKNSYFLIPFLAQSYHKGRFIYHLYFSLPLGGEDYTAFGGNPRDKQATLVFISGFEYDASKHVKYIMEYWFTNLGGFIDLNIEGLESFAANYNPEAKWLSYVFLGTRLSFRKRFYCELGISSYYIPQPPPVTGVVLNFGWYFR
ncbi:hypothetical protein ACFL5V_07885 [Fibrobacterota bacterium]